MAGYASSSLQGTDPATLQAWLSEAIQVRHDLMLGKRPAALSYAQGDGSKSVSYSPANLGELNSWIAQLEKALGLGRRRAIGVRF